MSLKENKGCLTIQIITLLDTAVGSTNKGDEIIMKCIEEELHDLLNNYFVMKVPTHFVSSDFFQNIGSLPDSANHIAHSKYKFICGTNLLSDSMFHRSNQWNINLYNSKHLVGCIGVGIGSLTKKGRMDLYTKMLYKKVLNKNMIHSVRDKIAEQMLKELGLDAVKVYG